MYVIIARTKGPENMTNEEIKNGLNFDGYEIESAEEVAAERAAGFLVYEDGAWCQYAEVN